MGIFSRMVNLFKSNANSALDKMEDPIKLYDLKMKELLESMHKVEGDTAEVIASVKKSDMELEKLDSEIKSIESMAKAAAKSGNRADVEKLLQHKADIKHQRDVVQATRDSLQNSADQAKATYERLKSAVEEMNRKKYVLQAKMTAAEAQQKINDITSSVNIGGINTESIEDAVDRKTLAAQAVAELRDGDNDIDSLINKYSSASADIQEEADALMSKYSKKSE